LVEKMIDVGESRVEDWQFVKVTIDNAKVEIQEVWPLHLPTRGARTKGERKIVEEDNVLPEQGREIPCHDGT